MPLGVGLGQKTGATPRRWELGGGGCPGLPHSAPALWGRLALGVLTRVQAPAGQASPSCWPWPGPQEPSSRPRPRPACLSSSPAPLPPPGPRQACPCEPRKGSGGAPRSSRLPATPATHLATPTSGVRTVGLTCVSAEVKVGGSCEAPTEREGRAGTGPCVATSLVSLPTFTKPGTNLG